MNVIPASQATRTRSAPSSVGGNAGASPLWRWSPPGGRALMRRPVDRGVPRASRSGVAGMANRLAGATSPYLLQHKENPVDWWPWEEAAFDEARRRDVPVLISVGYAACHWCHVMAHESFE